MATPSRVKLPLKNPELVRGDPCGCRDPAPIPRAPGPMPRRSGQPAAPCSLGSAAAPRAEGGRTGCGLGAPIRPDQRPPRPGTAPPAPQQRRWEPRALTAAAGGAPARQLAPCAVPGCAPDTGIAAAAPRPAPQEGLLLWQDPKKSAAALGAATAAFAFLQFAHVSFLQSGAYLLLVGVLGCFLWNNIATFAHRWEERVPRGAWGQPGAGCVRGGACDRPVPPPLQPHAG